MINEILRISESLCLCVKKHNRVLWISSILACAVVCAAEPAHEERATSQERADEQDEQTCSKSQKPDRSRPNSGTSIWPCDAQDTFAKGRREGTFASQSCRIGIV